MASFKGLASNSLSFGSFTDDLDSSKPIKSIPIVEICPRFENKYITNLDKAKSLIKSIEDVGLIEPINIIDINEYLKFFKDNGLNDKEKNYLTSMQDKGIKYFISSGHRRFKAYISVFLDKEINTDDEWENNFQEMREKFEKVKKEAAQAFSNGTVHPMEQWLTIPTIIQEDKFEKETAFYNDSNTTQRELTAFEIIINAIDEMKLSGYWEEAMHKIANDKVESMTDRKICEKINDLIKQGELSSEYSSKSIVDKKEYLKSLDVSKLPGTSKMIDKCIVDYVYENKKRNTSAQNVKNTRSIVEKFDSRMIQLIFDGYLNFKTAKEILPVYDVIDIDEAVEEIKNGTFKIDNYKERKKQIKFTSRQLLDLIYEIRNGTKTVDEVIELIENAEQ